MFQLKRVWVREWVRVGTQYIYITSLTNEIQNSLRNGWSCVPRSSLRHVVFLLLPTQKKNHHTHTHTSTYQVNNQTAITSLIVLFYPKCGMNWKEQKRGDREERNVCLCVRCAHSIASFTFELKFAIKFFFIFFWRDRLKAWILSNKSHRLSSRKKKDIFIKQIFNWWIKTKENNEERWVKVTYRKLLLEFRDVQKAFE